MVGFDRWYRAVSRSGSAYRGLLESALGEGQFVGQLGFSTRDQILLLARAALGHGEGPLLDVCCGAGGPAACISQALGAQVVGLDLSLAGLCLSPIAAVVGDAMRLPFADQSFGAALVLDSMASIQAPDLLFCELGRVLKPGAGLALTAEIGPPLDEAEQAQFTRSAPPTVLDEPALCASLGAAGLQVIGLADHTSAAADVAHRLATSLATRRADVVAELGHEAVDDLRATLTSLADLLATRRVSEKAVVARRR